MDPNIKAKWVEALRSGEYKQGIGLLRDCDGGFCCLGVLCHVIDPTKWTEEMSESLDYEPILEGYSYDKCESMLPLELAHALELDDYQDILISMNDKQRLPFTDIADYIEKRL